jgi:hypothetical protein
LFAKNLLKRLEYHKVILSDLENCKSKPNKTLLLAISYVYNTPMEWQLTGEGEMVREGSEGGAGKYKAGDPLDENPKIAELLDMAKEVFKSDTGYSDALTTNIRLFHYAIITEKQFEERLGKIEKKEKSRKERESRIRKGDNEAEKDTILKKRMVCVG